MRHLIIKLVTISSLILFYEGLQAQPATYVLGDSLGQGIRATQIKVFGNDEAIVLTRPHLSNAGWSIQKVDFIRNSVVHYQNANLAIQHFALMDNKIVVFAQEIANFPFGNYRVIVLDSSLNVTKDVIPVKANWPKPYLSILNIDEKTASELQHSGLFGRFFDSLTDSLRTYAWLKLSDTYDTLSVTGPILQTDTNFIVMGFYDAQGNTYASGGPQLVSTAWSSTINVDQIRKFGPNMQLLQATNTFLIPNIPNYSRTLKNNGLLNLILHQNSIFGATALRVADLNSLSQPIDALGILKFDANLTLSDAAHFPLALGRRLHVMGALTNIEMNHDKTALFVISSDCEPTNSFNNQNRTCELMVTKLDTSLQLLWQTRIGYPRLYIESETLSATADGGIMVAATMIDSLPNPNITKVLLVKLDSAGRHSVSVPELDAQPKVTVYPNPVVDQFTLHYSQGQYESLLLYNQNGQLVYRQPLDASTNLHKVSIGHLPGGMYFYALQGKGKPVRGKVVKGPGW